MALIKNNHGRAVVFSLLFMLVLSFSLPAHAGDTVWVPLNISFVPGIDFNMFAGGAAVNNIVFGIIGAGMGQLNGVAFSSVFTIIDDGGWGFVNSGVFTICSGDFAGVLASGVFNISSGTFVGVQLAGVFNSADTVYGAQIGVVNVAKNVSGVQIGLVNIADMIDGLAIGLVNLAKNKLMYFTSWYDEADMINVGLQLRYYPVTILLSSGIKSTRDLASAGVGFGLRQPLFGDGAVFVDGLAEYIFPQNPMLFPDLKNIASMLYSIRFGIELGIGYFNLYVGISYNFYRVYDAANAVPFSYVHQIDFLSQYYSPTEWPGFFVGVIF